VLLVDGGTTYLRHWIRESGLSEVISSLPETVWVGLSAGTMVVTPGIGSDFVKWPSAPGDRTLGVVDFSVYAHLDHKLLPGNTMADAERWAADGTVEVFSEGHWKAFPA
jgi:dipeptidase E